MVLLIFRKSLIESVPWFRVARSWKNRNSHFQRSLPQPCLQTIHPCRCISRRDAQISCMCENFAPGKKPVVRDVFGVRLDFDGEVASQVENSLQAARRFERGQREKEIGQAMTPGQNSIRNI